MKKIILLVVVAFFSATISAQVVPNKDFVTYPPSGGTREMISNVPSALDLTNSAGFISGYTRNTTSGRDYLLIKYDLNGNILWQKIFDYAGLNDRALAITVDNSGNTYITGEATSLSNGTDILTQKYNPSGTLLWSVSYNGSANADDKGLGIVVDNSGDVYICGYTSNTGTGKDFAVIHYNSSGVQQYVYTKNGTANGDDAANAIAYFGNKLYVTGNITNTGSGADIYTTRLNANNASVNWSKSEDGTAGLDDQSLDIKVMGNDVMICGGITNTGTGQDYFFGKYNASNGTTVFTKNYDAFGTNDFATSLVYDASNTYAITGLAQNGSNYEYHTVKYNNGGVFQWTNKHNLNTTFLNVYPKIAVDPIANHFYVSGVTLNASIDAALYQITPGGNESWVDYHDGFGMRDAHVDLSVDNLGRIYLASLNERTLNTFDIAFIRYSQTPVFFPIDYNNVNVPFSNAHLYYKNTGEILNTNNLPATDVLFYTNKTNPRVFVQNNSMSFAFAKVDTSNTNPKDSLTRADLVFVGSNSLTKPYNFDEQGNNLLNFFLPHTGSSGITDVKGSTRLMIPNIYPNIDLHYYSNSGGLKYYFVIKPGGEISSIKLHLDGTSSNSLNGNNDLLINTTFGGLSFKKPVAYNVTPGLTTPSTTATWVNTGVNDYEFNIGTYSPALPLVIEIERGLATATASTCDWSTYHGSPGGESGESIITDAAGNAFFSGQTDSPLFPNTFGGAYSYVGGQDCFLVKFNSSGVPQWGTFYGGNADETVGEIAINSAGNIYIVGTTLSNNLPLFPVANTTLNGLQDGFIAKFNSLGNALLFARYFGGANSDAISSIAIDASDNVYFVGSTGGGGSFPITPKGGAYNQSATTASNGAPDAFIAELDLSDNLIWASNFGGDGADNFSCVRVGVGNHVLCAGSTISQTQASSNIANPVCGVPTSPTYYPDCNPGGGAYYSTYTSGAFGVERDAIIVEYDVTGALLWSTYFGGKGDEDSQKNKFYIAVNPSNPNIFYLTGITDKLTGFPTQAIGTEYVQTFSPFGPIGFIAKFNNRQKVWATTFGAGANTYIRGAACDNNDNLYIVGRTDGNNYAANTCGPPANPANQFPKCQQSGVFFQPAYVGGTSEGFICAFNAGNKLIWSSYYGGNSLDEARSVSYDGANKRIYMTGITQSTSGFPLLDPSTGNWQLNTNSGGVNSKDTYVARFCVSQLIAIGIHEYSNSAINGDLLVYPNPTDNNFTIEFNAPAEKGIVNIQLYNSVGKLIVERKENLNYSFKFSFNTNSYAKGVYFIRVSTATNSYNSKLIID